MQGHVRHTRFIALLLALTLCYNGFAHAAKPSHRLALLQAALPQQTPSPAAPPEQAAPPAQQPVGVRDRLRSAHTLFITQPGNDRGFLLTTDDTYNTVLDAVNQWGRYTIAPDVSHADLVLQLRGVVTASEITSAPDANTGATSTSVVYSSSLQVTVADPHSLASLWVINLPVEPAFRQKTRANNTLLLGQAVVTQLKLLTGDPLTRQEQAQLKQANKSHLGLILGLVGASVAIPLGLFFLSRHLAQEDQASFCAQHGISPCPGT